MKRERAGVRRILEVLERGLQVPGKRVRYSGERAPEVRGTACTPLSVRLERNRFEADVVEELTSIVGEDAFCRTTSGPKPGESTSDGVRGAPIQLVSLPAPPLENLENFVEELD